MPYEVEKSGDDYVVKKPGKGGKVFGRHKSKKKARAQQSALYANTEESMDRKKMINAVASMLTDDPDHLLDAIVEKKKKKKKKKKNSGIPERYKKKGFTKVGVKKKSTQPGKKWMVLAKKGDKYKIVHGGDSNMKDYSQHGSEKRQKAFWDRMGGKDSAKAKDPFSPLYWHKKFGTW